MSKARVQKIIRNSLNPYEDCVGIVYARVSSKRQELEGSGLESQEGRCLTELDILKVPHAKTFKDSYSGGGDFMNRPAMRGLLAYIDANPHKRFLVIFDDLKRFARDVEFHLKLRTAFKIRDVQLKCLNFNFEDTSEGRYVETILAAGAELERDQNKRQVVQKQRARLEAGYWAFGSKKGYKMSKDPVHGKISIPNEPEATLLKTAMEGFSTGIFIRPVDACKYLVEQGLWDRKPERYTEKFINYLRDPFYAGYIEYLAWEVTRREGKHTGIVSIETFNLNQKRLDEKKPNKRIRVDTSNEFPFRGLLICDECGGHLTGVIANGRHGKYPIYYCQNIKCSLYRKSFRKKDIEDDFKKLLDKQILKQEVSELLTPIFNRVWDEELKGFENKVKKEEQLKLELKEKIAHFAELAEGTKSDTVRRIYEKQIEELAPTLEVIEQSKSQIIDTDTPYRTALNKATTLLKSPYKYWVSVDVTEKQRLFFFIFDQKIPYSKIDGYRTDKSPMSVRLFEEFVTTNPLDVEMGGSEPPCKKVSYSILHV